MLVYGDRARVIDPRAEIAALGERLRALESHRGLERHARLVGAFIAASELAQAIADAARAAPDAPDPASDAAMAVSLALAGAVDRSWRGDHTAGALPRALDDARATLGRAATCALPERAEARHAEGYAYYALYPEAYLAAARGASPGPRRVIGIRSIGAGLAALVASVHGAPPPITVRPHGHPFRRAISVAPHVLAAWTGADAIIAIADEGPGLSGSSFGAVLDVLEARGVPLDRVECYPSHAGELGPEASDAHRARWRRVRRHVVDADALLVRSGRLAAWIAGLIGPLDGELEDISGGAWRARLFAGEHAWPPAVVQQERRKLLARAGGATWLARFVGLGDDGERAVARARMLAAAAFTPDVAGLVHGFLVERWRDDARPLDLRACDRRALVAHVGRYLGFRARAFPARAAGASPAQLAEMIRVNAGVSVRPPAASADPVEIDGRLHAWEWLVDARGRIVKADAYDHHAAHDLVGCQDIAWDVAGAGVELALTPEEQRTLLAVVTAHAGRAPDPAWLAFARTAYVAFQLGRHALAAGAAGPEAGRLDAAARRYAALIDTRDDRPEIRAR